MKKPNQLFIRMRTKSSYLALAAYSQHMIQSKFKTPLITP